MPCSIADYPTPDSQDVGTEFAKKRRPAFAIVSIFEVGPLTNRCSAPSWLNARPLPRIPRLDHVGFNLPWFGRAVHPAIADLRNRLKQVCLYHLFLTGEPWDFIIPGELAKIRKLDAIDYNQIRRPKFEIVSFDRASTPLVQIDLSVPLL